MALPTVTVHVLDTDMGLLRASPVPTAAIRVVRRPIRVLRTVTAQRLLRQVLTAAIERLRRASRVCPRPQRTVVRRRAPKGLSSVPELCGIVSLSSSKTLHVVAAHIVCESDAGSVSAFSKK